MRIFRELHQSDDNPFRREHRRKPSPTKDEGDLFIHRPSPRKIRILLDIETLAEDTSEPVQLFEALIQQQRVFALEIETSTIASTDYSTPVRQGMIRVRDTTAVQGSFGYPGPQYGWSIADRDAHLDGSSTMQKGGSSHPLRQIGETVAVYRNLERRHRTEFRLHDAVAQAIVGEVARDAGFDILVSEAPVSACRFLPVHDRVVVLSRAEAVPVIAHYLRRQHIFLFDPCMNGHFSRHDFYKQAVHSLAPAMRGWEARLGLALSEVSEAVQARYFTAVNRLARALESRDDLIWSLGSHLTQAVRDDCVDDFDHLLLMLCGGVDVMARALHLALGLDADPQEVRSAKLHIDSDRSWYTTNIVERYGVNPAERAALGELSRLQTAVQVIFELRNSIHNVQIQAFPRLRAGFGSPTLRGGAPCSAHVTADIATKIKEIAPGLMDEWGFVEIPRQGAIADLWALADKAVETTFKFLDLLSLIVLRNPLTEPESAVLSGPAPPISSGMTLLPGFGDHLPALLGISAAQYVEPDESMFTADESTPGEAAYEHTGNTSAIPSVQETWWRAHIRSALTTLRGTPPAAKDDGMIPEQWINDALDAARRDSTRQWPDAMNVARTIIVDRNLDLG